MSGDTTNSIINIGIDSKPANTLVERVCDLFGGWFKPFQIRRVTKAEVEADIMIAKGEVKVDEIKRRAVGRMLEEEEYKQQNIEQITTKAFPFLEEDSKPEEIEKEWLFNFFDKCKLVSDDEMQTLWSKILAGEANKKGSYSKRAINALASIDREEAELFSRLCRFCVIIDDEFTFPLLVREKHKYGITYYEEREIGYSSLQDLDDIGLISFDYDSKRIYSELKENITLDHFAQKELLESTELSKKSGLDIGMAVFTNVGLELSKICSKKPEKGHLDHVKRCWQRARQIKDPNPVSSKKA
jgi:Protein of unknown function (DUF2806)